MKMVSALSLLSLLLVQVPMDFEVIDQVAFDELFPKGATVRKLGGGMVFTEGPAWMAEPGADISCSATSPPTR